MPEQLTELEQEVFDYLNDTPNARQSKIETLAARISHEMDVRYSEALVIVEKWRDHIDTWMEIQKDIAAILAKHHQDALLMTGYCNGQFRNTVINNAALEDTEHVQFLILLSDTINEVLSNPHFQHNIETTKQNNL